MVWAMFSLCICLSVLALFWLYLAGLAGMCELSVVPDDLVSVCVCLIELCLVCAG